MPQTTGVPDSSVWKPVEFPSSRGAAAQMTGAIAAPAQQAAASNTRYPSIYSQEAKKAMSTSISAFAADEASTYTSTSVGGGFAPISATNAQSTAGGGQSTAGAAPLVVVLEVLYYCWFCFASTWCF